MPDRRRRRVAVAAATVAAGVVVVAPLPFAAGATNVRDIQLLQAFLAPSDTPTADTSSDASAGAPFDADASKDATTPDESVAVPGPLDATDSPAPASSEPSAPTTPPPGSPVTPEVITRAETGRPEVAITLDADLSEWTRTRVRNGELPPQVNTAALDYLEQTGTPSTVFVTGLWAQEYPWAMTRMAENPLYELASHSWDHGAWTSDCYGLPLAQGDPVANIAYTAAIIESYTGEYPTFFRFPGLCHDPADVELVASLGQRTVDYDLNGSDAFAYNADLVASNLLDQIQPGSIVVLHLNGAPNAPMTTQILQQLVPGLAERGLEPVTLEQLTRSS